MGLAPLPTRVSRAPLPGEVSALPALDPAFGAALDPALAALGLTLAPGARRAIEAHVRLLLAWNVAINLTAVRTPAAIAVAHVADSLAAIELIRSATAGDRRPDLLDLGSGPGFPGLPLAVALPVRRAALVDATGKKVRFLALAAAAARSALDESGEPAPALDAVAERAEILATNPAHRARWDLVTARAVAALPGLVELALPLLRVGGTLIAWKRDAGDGSLDRELANAHPVCRALGADQPVTTVVSIPGLADHRLVSVLKLSETPAGYPRSPVERRRPLR